jgi:hypothetical protein
MNRPQSRRQRKEAFLKRASEMYEELEGWYDEHPEASLGEIEEKARGLRRGLMGEGIGILLNGRHGQMEVAAPVCPGCGKGMRFVGYRRKQISGIEGEMALERSYYVCSAGCGETFFPPGPPLATPGGSL